MIVFITLLPNSYEKVQALVLLLICGFYFFITFEKKPFSFKSINYLEDFSNFSSFLIILAANFAISKTDLNVTLYLSLIIIIFSLCFLIIWIIVTFDIFFFQKTSFFKKKFIRFYYFYMTLHKSITLTKNSWNLKFYIQKIFANFKIVKQKYNSHRKSKNSILHNISPNNRNAKRKKILTSIFDIFNEIN